MPSLTPSQALALASRIFSKKYRGADCAFCAGSIMRGKGTPTSDIDLVVVFKKLNTAYRESYVYEGTPVEAFVHDPETLNYFFEKDRKESHGSILDMVSSGVVLPCLTKTATSLVKRAEKIITKGPPRLSKQTQEQLRYAVTDLIDDLRGGLNDDEKFVVCVGLFEKLSEIVQRQSGQWTGNGKYAARLIRRTNPKFIKRYRSAMDRLLADNDVRPLVELGKSVLAPWGGFLFEGYKALAPKSFRAPMRK